MDKILKLFESFGFINESKNQDKYIFNFEDSSIQIDLVNNEISLIENNDVLRVPKADLNAIAFLAYSMTSKIYRAKLSGLESPANFLNKVLDDRNNEAESEYNEHLLEVHSKYLLLTKFDEK